VEGECGVTCGQTGTRQKNKGKQSEEWGGDRVVWVPGPSGASAKVAVWKYRNSVEGEPALEHTVKKGDRVGSGGTGGEL